MNRCPVCMYPNLPYPAEDYHICPSCGTEFGNDDADQSHEALRDEWILRGAPWFFGNPPQGWNATQQLLNAGANYFTTPAVDAFEFAGGAIDSVELKSADDTADRVETVAA